MVGVVAGKRLRIDSERFLVGSVVNVVGRSRFWCCRCRGRWFFAEGTEPPGGVRGMCPLVDKSVVVDRHLLAERQAVDAVLNHSVFYYDVFEGVHFWTLPF